ncbi:MAG: orotate phosphoribosyltransferase [Bacteroidota bacterium]|nr:orotate phosphoribosyltransferase [Bacteroidota bacterium]
MTNISNRIISGLLEIGAIQLRPDQPFKWASGWNSPIYCDNRKTLSFPRIRKLITKNISEIIKEKYPDVEVIAGVATGAIAQGALVSDLLDLPYVYIRSSAKGHGMGNLIEGKIVAGQKVVVIEDLISTGGSSLKAVEALRKSDCDVLGMIAIFSYGFQVSKDNFTSAHCELTTLAGYGQLIEQALETGLIKENEANTLKEWRKSPQTWSK